MAMWAMIENGIVDTDTYSTAELIRGASLQLSPEQYAAWTQDLESHPIGTVIDWCNCRYIRVATEELPSYQLPATGGLEFGPDGTAHPIA